ncbi:MAG: hypothetical protein JST08_02850 [Actinobacteria bacterium]|nr:hypothetical protein [Actinomycetota bacterium]
MMPAPHISMVFSAPTPGRDDDYNKWYDEVHLPESLTVPGYVGAHRYRLSEDQAAGMPPSPYAYLTIYELDRPPAEPLAALTARLESQEIAPPDSIDVGSIRSWAYSRIASASAPDRDRTTPAPHVAVAFSAPTAGREDDYNRWYDEVHLDEALSLPGHVGAHRYRLSEDQLASMPPSPYSYLAIYELDRPPAEPLAALAEALESGAITLPDSIDPDSLRSWTFSSISA